MRPFGSLHAARPAGAGRVPEGGGGRGETEGGSLVGIHPHPGPTRRGIRSRGEGTRRRNEARRERRRRGQQKWFGERVVVGGLKLMSVYQPSWGADGEGMEICRRDMERQVAMGNRERIVIGGDFNASIGKGERRGVCGKYGLGRGNEAGRDLVDWCEEMGMAHVNSFMSYKTWRHPATGRWHELDGFLVRVGERQTMVRRVWTRDERDHRAGKHETECGTEKMEDGSEEREVSA